MIELGEDFPVEVEHPFGKACLQIVGEIDSGYKPVSISAADGIPGGALTVYDSAVVGG